MNSNKHFFKRVLGTIAFISFFSFSCNSQNSPEENFQVVGTAGLPITIKGTLKSNIADKIYLERMNERNIPTIIDSTLIDLNKEFGFSTSIPEPGIYQVNIVGQQVIGLILDGGENVVITADGEASPDKMPEFKIEGVPNILKFNTILAEVQNFNKLRQSLEADFQKASKSEQNTLRQQYQTSFQNHNSTIKPMIAELGTSLTGIIAANNFLNPDVDGVFLNELKNNIEAEGKDHYFANLFIQTMNRKSVGMEGTVAPDFDLVSLSGEQVKLSDLRGKTVIIDFWATWCGPCIKSFPGMKKAQDKYADNEDVVFLFINTFERVPETNWKSHVQAFVDKRNYQFLNPTLDIGSQTALAYGVEGIPAKFCVGPDGTIKHKSTGFRSSEAIYAEMVEWIED